MADGSQCTVQVLLWFHSQLSRLSASLAETGESVINLFYIPINVLLGQPLEVNIVKGKI